MNALTCEELSKENLEDKNPKTTENLFQQEENALKQSHQQVIYSAKRLKRLMARLRTPAWLSNSGNVWEVCCYKAKSGWMFTAQTYRVVPEDSQIMQFAIDGDVKGIQELFGKNMASPYDRVRDGQTVLDVSAFNIGTLPQSQSSQKLIFVLNKVAAFYHQLGVCRFLLAEGADPNMSRAGCVM